ncbi:PAS domain-containing protein, partial [Frankia sp. R82]|uniref:PAS domain-containing protein n=1 Tax=Frankia sp. R82 TaxID=2950553 RepID=UPI002042D17E
MLPPGWPMVAREGGEGLGGVPGGAGTGPGRGTAAASGAGVVDPAIAAYALLDALFARASVGLALLDRAGRFVRVNDTLSRLARRPVQDHLGRTVSEVLGDTGQELDALVAGALRTGEPVIDLEVGVAGGAGAPTRTWSASWFPVNDPQLGPVGLAFVAVDVTSVRQAERDRGQAEALAVAAEQQATAAEQRATAAEQRADAAQQQVDAVQQQAVAAQQRAEAAEQRAEAAEHRAEVAEEQVTSTQAQVDAGQQQLETALRRAQEAEAQVVAAREQVGSATEQASSADRRLAEAQARAQAADERAEAAVGRAEAADRRAEQSAERAEAAESRATAAERQAEQSADQAAAANQRAQNSEEQAVATQRLAEATAQQATATEDRLEAGSRFAVALAGADTVDEVVTAILDAGGQAVQAEARGVALIDPDHDELRFLRPPGGGSRAWSWPDVALGAVHPIAEVVRGGRALFLSDQAELLARWPVAGLADSLAATGEQAWALLPLIPAEGAPVGVVTFGFPTARTFTPAERTYLGGVAAAAARAIERAGAFDRLTVDAAAGRTA